LDLTIGKSKRLAKRMSEKVLNRCFFVEKNEDDGIRSQVSELPPNRWPQEDVRIAVEYSSVNYKDAMAATGNPGIVRSFPHVPGIDAAGKVVECRSGNFQVGDEVVVTGRDLGVGTWGGWASEISVPADWVLPKPEGLSNRECMVLGTAGFTAAQCVSALVAHDVRPENGPIVVTGATGGVGSLAVRLMAKLGYTVAAVTGKKSMHDQLSSWGVSEFLSREEANDPSARPLLSARWAGAVDTVGGPILTTILRAMKYRGCVAACGLTAGVEMEMTVLPFLLRGITLCGIDSAACPREPREEIWRLLAGPWRLDNLDDGVSEIGLDDVKPAVETLLRGESTGRFLVRI
jgi:putative YhdH/YhfP family quinone oxidoreductase